MQSSVANTRFLCSITKDFVFAPGHFAIAMLCAKCHLKEARVHFTTLVDGTQEETVHLCKDCAPPMGFDLDHLDLEQLEALSIIGKKCEFCGKDAFFGQMHAGGGAINWCFDCGLEFAKILSDSILSERPDLLKRSKEQSSFLAFCSDPDLQAWSEAASQKALQTLKERRRQDGRDKVG